MRIRINLQLKKKMKVRNDGKCPVYARYVMNSRRIELSTSVYVALTDWDNLRQQIIGNSKDIRILNNRLSKFISHINDVFDQLEAGREDFDVYDIKNRLTGTKS